MKQTTKKSQKQLEFKKVKGWGGARRGAGRPNLSGLVNHMERPRVNLKAPLHITMRLKKGLSSLRNKRLLREFKECVKGAKKQGLYVLHFSIQSNHLHLIAEATSNDTLARGMRALAGRFAKIIRHNCNSPNDSIQKDSVKDLLQKGSVFAGRYHLHVLKTPREMRNALEYVLLNLSKHQKFIEYIDEFSSGMAFAHWKKLLGTRFRSLIQDDSEFWERHSRSNSVSDLKEVLSPSRSWLAQTGWQKAVHSD